MTYIALTGFRTPGPHCMNIHPTDATSRVVHFAEYTDKDEWTGIYWEMEISEDELFDLLQGTGNLEKKNSFE